ncbi:MAG: nucleotidyltransferase [Acidimicrobiia bacterium]|nr:nucleotidyltransferase [Acidimicrobiia bacterium]
MEHANYFKSFLREQVNLDDTRLATLEKRVEAVYDALKADRIIGDLITGKRRQGSWAHRLIIKPRPDGEYDADFMLEIDEVDGWEPQTYIDEVYNALHRHSTYKKQKHGRKCRCVYLDYAPVNGVGCHLDIVPFVTLGDGRRVIVNRDDNAWEPRFGSTNPQGFTDWIKVRAELTNGQFREVVRLMKYLRDQRGSFDGVRSVVLTTVLGLQINEWKAADPQRYRNLPTALLNIVEDLDQWLQARPSKPFLENPSGDGTNFDHRWSEETYTNFRDRLHTIAAEMRAAYDEEDPEKSVSAWQKLLGDKFRPSSTSTASGSSNPFSGAASAVSAAGSSRVGRSG